MLRCQDGFIAKFYAISETISPVLAWGFLGTDDKLKYDCEKFKVRVIVSTKPFVRAAVLNNRVENIVRAARSVIQTQILDLRVSNIYTD